MPLAVEKPFGTGDDAWLELVAVGLVRAGGRLEPFHEIFFSQVGGVIDANVQVDPRAHLTGG